MSPFHEKLIALVNEECRRIKLLHPVEIIQQCVQASAVMANLAGQMIAATGASGRELDSMVMQSEIVVRQGVDLVNDAVRQPGT